MRLFVAGHKGLVGSAMIRRLQSEPFDVVTAARSELDLRDPHAAVTMEEIGEHLDNTFFAWIGLAEDDSVFYYDSRWRGLFEFHWE